MSPFFFVLRKAVFPLDQRAGEYESVFCEMSSPVHNGYNLCVKMIHKIQLL